MTRKKFVKQIMARLGRSRNQASQAAQKWNRLAVPYRNALTVEIIVNRKGFYQSAEWYRLRQRLLCELASRGLYGPGCYVIDHNDDPAPSELWPKQNPYMLSARFGGTIVNHDGFVAPTVIFDEMHGAGGGRHE